jgi:hypothetical protein
MNSKVNAGEGEDASEEHGIILAASIMNRSLGRGLAVGLGANGKQFSWFRPRMDETQRWSILRGLALLEKGNDPLTRLLEVARNSIRFRSSIIVITADLSGIWLDPVLLMRKKGIIPTILLLNAPAFGGEGDHHFLQAKLNKLGLNNYLINPDYLDNARTQDYPKARKPDDMVRDSRKIRWRPSI